MSCNDDRGSCSEKYYGIAAFNKPNIQTLRNLDSIYFKRNHFGNSDTILFTKEDFVENVLIYDDCPFRKVIYDRVSLRLVSEDDEKLVLEIFTYPGTTAFCTFFHKQVLYSSAGGFDEEIDLETGNFADCLFQRNIINNNYRTGYSEKVISEYGELDIKSDITDYNSTAYYNLQYGLVNINLYTGTDSVLTYQRIP
mgnify:CR=1 FL=1